MSFRHLKAIFFDHDGTLVDSETPHCQHWIEALAEHKVEFTEETYRTQYVGVPTKISAERMVQEYNLSVAPETLMAAADNRTIKLLETQAFPLMPFAQDAIFKFKELGLTLGVVTGAYARYVENTIKHHNLENLFAVISAGDQVENTKPAPDVYLAAMAALNLRPEECLAIEDTQTGLTAARAANVPCCVVPNSFTAHQDFTGAVARFNHLGECLNWVISQRGNV